MHRGFSFFLIRSYLLLFCKPSLRFILFIGWLFCFFSTTIVLWGLFFFMAWRDILLCFLVWSKRLQTVCAMMDTDLHMFTAFVRVVQLLHTYTAYLVRTLYSFCVRIRLIFVMFNADSLKGSDLERSLIYFVRANTRDFWTVSRDPILRVPSIYFVLASCS